MRAGVRDGGRTFALCFLLLLVTASSARAQEPPPDECEPLLPSSLELVASRLDLDPEQVAWLKARLERGDLERPEDLAGLPGATEAILHELESTWCWGERGAGEAGFAIRRRARGTRAETRASLSRGGWELRGRWLREGEREVRRGALGVTYGPLRVRAGTLAARQGLGLLLATPGAESRGGGPREGHAGRWSASTALDERMLAGGVVALETAGIQAEVARLSRSDPGGTDTAPLTVLSGLRRWAQSLVGTTFVHSGSAWGGGFQGSSRTGAGAWWAEAAWAGGGNALGLSWRLDPGSWRLRASLLRVGEGFVPPGKAAPEKPGVRWSGEIRWQGGPARYLRLTVGEEGAPDGLDFSQHRRERALEISEGFRRGLRVLATWRERVEAGESVDGLPEPVEDMLRMELRLEERPWTGRLRHEERKTPKGRARLTDLRVGAQGNAAWEVRLAFLNTEGDAPSPALYARRAGGLYGWERPGRGARVGTWGAWRAGAFRLEVSLDAGSEGLDGALALGWGVSRRGGA